MPYTERLFFTASNLGEGLNPGKTRQAISGIGFRLAWLFNQRNVEKIIKGLGTYRGAISLRLQVEQTYVIIRPVSEETNSACLQYTSSWP
jgi:hypothetical protein